MYCLHQSEEHAYDLRGWRYSFVPSFNTGPLSAMFEETCAKMMEETSCPLDPKVSLLVGGYCKHGDILLTSPGTNPTHAFLTKVVLYINATVVWVDFSLCTIAASFNPTFLLAISLNWGMCFVNALAGHVIPALLTKSYNPGSVQSAIMAPMALFIIQRSDRPLLCIAYGILGHLLLIMGVKITLKFQTDEALTTTAFMLFANLFMPLAISHQLGRKRSKKSN